jgi:elongation factor G
VHAQDTCGNAVVISAHVPLAQMFGYIGHLRAMTSGRAQFTMQLDHYAEVPAARVAALAA